MQMTWYYALELEDEKYYIGMSNNIKKRMYEHFSGKGSQWTQTYKPISVLEKYESDNELEERELTLKYMQKYGYENVRGYCWVTIKLEVSPLQQNTETICQNCPMVFYNVTTWRKLCPNCYNKKNNLKYRPRLLGC